MPEPLQHVSPGQPLLPSMKASTWNRFIDMANDNKRQFGPRGNPAGLSRLTPSIRVLIQNDTGADLDEFAVVQVSDPAVIPIPPVIASSGVLDNRFDVNSRPLLSAVEVNDLKACYVVTCEPIAEDVIGEAVICGVTVVTVNITDATHKFADVEVGSYNLKSGETGRARIIHKESTGTGDKLCVVHVEQIPSEGVVPASADCSIQINTCPIFKWIKNVAGVLTEYTTDPGSAIRVQDGITVEYQGWCGPITAASWSSGTATVTSAGHPLVAGDIVTITGVTPTGYNASGVTITATTSTTISYAVTSDPGTYTSGGTISAPNVIYCVHNPTGCCEEGTSESLGVCGTCDFSVPSRVWAVITNKTGDGLLLPDSFEICYGSADCVTAGWSPSSGPCGTVWAKETDLPNVADGGLLGLNFALLAGCSSTASGPSVQLIIDSYTSITPASGWAILNNCAGGLLVNPGGVYVGRVFPCSGSPLTWEPVNEPVASVVYTTGTFDIALTNTPP